MTCILHKHIPGPSRVKLVSSDLNFALFVQEKFASMIADAGFQDVEYENLVGGVVAIHSGFKL